MKAAAPVVGLAVVLVMAATALAGGSTVTTTLAGVCTDHQTLDSNGALKSLTTTCKTSGKCSCTGSSNTGPTKLIYTSKILAPGNGASGKETGTLVATSPSGTVTLNFAGKRTSLGVGTGTWTLGKVTGFKGITLARRGAYSVTTRTVSQVVGTFNSHVQMNAAFGCWACSGS
jgi:hypothetical protein